MKDVTKPTCFETSVAELWATHGFDDPESQKSIDSVTQQDIIDAINSQNRSQVFLFDKNFVSYLGGVERNLTNHIIGAKATIIQFFGLTNLSAVTREDIKSNTFGAATDKETLDFEKHLLEALLGLPQNENVRTYINIARSFTDLSNEAVYTDVVGLIIGTGIVYFYVLLMIGGFGCVEQKVLNIF